jgi:dipeptidyl aminopeptidase/acylaminoacyl peptidase
MAKSAGCTGVLRRIFLTVPVIVFICSRMVTLSVQAVHEQDALPIEEVLRSRNFAPGSPTRFSLDGKWLAYTVIEGRNNFSSDSDMWLRTGVPWYGKGGQIYVLNVASDKTTEIKITSAETDNWLPTWSPNSRYLAFFSDRDGSGQAKAWIWDSELNRLRKIADVKVRGDRIEWSKDGRNILFTTIPRDLTLDQYLNRVSVSVHDAKSTVANDAPAATITLYESRVDQSGGRGLATSDPWNLGEKLRDLVLLDTESGEVRTLVRNRKIAAYQLSPDGSRIAYTVPTRFEKPGSQQILFDLDVVMIGTGQSRIAGSDIRLDHDGAAFSWSPDGTRLSFRGGGPAELAGDCYLVDLGDGGTHNLSMFPPSKTGDSPGAAEPVWDATGSEIYFIRDGNLWRADLDQERSSLVAQIPSHRITELIAPSLGFLWTVGRGRSTIVLAHDEVGKQDGFYEIDLTTGQSTRLLEKGQCYSCISEQPHVAVSGDDRRAAYLVEDAGHCSDLWLSDSTFGEPRRLTHVNPELDRYRMGKAQLIDWLNDDGEPLQGALLLPADYKKGERYPLIVWVYGGNSVSDHFDHFGLAYPGPFNMQLFASRGYAVLLPDAPSHLGTPMLDVAKSVLPGVNKAIELGIADPDHLGIMGHSNGGYSTVALMVQTKRFKAAMEVAGMADLLGLYGEMDKDGTAFGIPIIEHGQDALGGTPWEFRERYAENSPFFYLDRVETPLLVVQGAEDTGVAPFLGDQIFTALRRLGKEVTYAKYSGEEHDPSDWSYANQLDFCTRMIAWFDSHLKGHGR